MTFILYPFAIKEWIASSLMLAAMTVSLRATSRAKREVIQNQIHRARIDLTRFYLWIRGSISILFPLPIATTLHQKDHPRLFYLSWMGS